MQRFIPVIVIAKSHGLRVRGYVSCAVDCPYEGEIAPGAVALVSLRLGELGCYEVAVSDTIGRGSPDRVDVMLQHVLERIPASMLACHFHDTSRRALDNVDVALKRKITTFDSAVAGLGGCPYAPGATGNVATGAIVSHLHKHGYSTGIDPVGLRIAEDFALACALRLDDCSRYQIDATEGVAILAKCLVLAERSEQT